MIKINDKFYMYIDASQFNYVIYNNILITGKKF